MQFINAASSVNFAVTIPYALAGLTLLYLERSDRTPRVPATVAAPVAGSCRITSFVGCGYAHRWRLVMEA